MIQIRLKWNVTTVAQRKKLRKKDFNLDLAFIKLHNLIKHLQKIESIHEIY